MGKCGKPVGRCGKRKRIGKIMENYENIFRMELYCRSTGVFIFEAQRHFSGSFVGWGGSIFSTVKSSRTCGRPGIIVGKCYFFGRNLMGTDGEYCRCSLKWWILKSPWGWILQFALTWMIWSTKTMESCIPFTSINASNSRSIIIRNYSQYIASGRKPWKKSQETHAQ